MRMAIISCGPSAPMYPGPADFDVVAGINTAVERWECDWWVFKDRRLFGQVHPKGCPRVFTSEVVIERLGDLYPDDVERFSKLRDVVGFHDSIKLDQWWDAMSPELAWDAYSGIASLALAWRLRPDEVMVYGADMGGLLDFRGLDSGSRSDDRWKTETAIWVALITILERYGIRVGRVGHIGDDGRRGLPTSNEDARADESDAEREIVA